MTATARAIEGVKHTCSKGWSNAGGGTRRPVTSLVVEFFVKELGPSHVCGVYYTKDLWKTRETAYAECVRVEGLKGRGGTEKWVAHVELPTHAVARIQYVVFCFDHTESNQIKRLYDKMGVSSTKPYLRKLPGRRPRRKESTHALPPSTRMCAPRALLPLESPCGPFPLRLSRP